MEPRLRLAERFTHLVRAGGSVVLVEDEDAFVLDEPLAVAVVPLLDGSRTAVDIAHELADLHPRAEVHYVVLRLLRAGLALEAEGAASTEGAALGDAAGPPSLADALASLWAARVRGGVVPVPLDMWQGPGGMRLVLTDDYLRPEVASLAGSQAPHERLLLAGLGARRIWLGPVIGAEASCIECLRDRLRLNLTGRSLVHLAAAATEGLEVVTLPAHVPVEAHLMLADLLADPGVVARAAGTLLTVPLGGGRAPRAHRIPRLPQCPSCGDPSLTVPGPELALEPRPRSGGSGGGWRTVSPEETLRRYSALVSPLVGVVRRIEKVPVEGTGLVHVYTASHAHHYGMGNVRAVKDDRRDHSGGKGRSDTDARVSALCESMERFSSVHRGDEPTRLARRSDLGERTRAPNELMGFSEAQYAGREAWNAKISGLFQYVPEPYRDQPVEWSRARSLVSGETWSVPSSLVFHGFRGEGTRFGRGDSNGLAGGNCLEEAILQGFFELVERDAIALWWYNRAGRPGVDLRAREDAWVDAVLDLYESIDRDLWALDLTTDLGIPTYAAISAQRTEAEQDIIFGFGAHLDARIALIRALTELNQMLPTIQQSREARRLRLLPDFADALRWWDEATLESEPYLLPNADPPPCAARSTEAETGDLLADVQRCISSASAAGCDVLVYDLTRPDVGFPVAKVIVPGLRHFWRRLGAGRLYDVPCRLGWMERRLREEELNPVSMFV